jgi:perosamine synthetase
MKDSEDSVPDTNYSFRLSHFLLREEEIAAMLERVDGVLRSGTFSHGTETRRFEEEFARFLSISHAVAVNSGTTALEICLRAIGVAGGEVLLPSNTNFATAIAAVNAGARPRFYDGGLFLDLDDAERGFSDRTRAVIVVHIGGYISPALPAVQELCKDRGVPLIEDAAHAHGAHLNGKLAGTFGVAAAFSFYYSKVLTTGEGGILVTNDETIAREARIYREQGRSEPGNLHVLHGNTWRMTEMSAALGSVLLESFLDDTAHRNRAVRLYRDLLADHPLVTFPELPPSDRLSGYKAIAMLSAPELREPLRAALDVRGVELDREVYAVPLHVQPIFRQFVTGACPVADRFSQAHICLPIWRSIDPKEVTHAATLLRQELDRTLVRHS